MKLGQCARDIFPKTHTLEAASGPMLYTLGFLVALVMWSFGLVWLFFASASIARSQKFPFNIGWWGFTFPLGVYASSTIQMGTELPSRFFNVLGTVSHLVQFFTESGADSICSVDIVALRGSSLVCCHDWYFAWGGFGQVVFCPVFRGSAGA